MKTTTFQGIQTLDSIMGPVAESRKLFLGPCALNITTRRGPNRVAVAHAWLHQANYATNVANVAKDILADFQVKGVKTDDVQKVVEALIEANAFKVVIDQAAQQAMYEENVRKLTAIPLVTAQYGNLHGGATEGFYARVVNRVVGVKEDIQKMQAGISQENLVEAEAPESTEATF